MSRRFASDRLTPESLLARAPGVETWSAHDEQAGRVVAKTIVGPVAQRRFATARLAHEALALRRSAHPFVVRALEAHEHGDERTLVLEWINAGSLGEQHPLGAAATAATLAPVAHALAAAHAAGVVHRDVKPENVLATARGGVLVDFGAAAVDGVTYDGWSEHGSRLVARTEEYAAPETATAAPQPSLDVWSFGMTVLEVATGTHDLAHVDDPALRDLVRASLDPAPAARPTMTVVAAALDQIAGSATPVAVAPPPIATAPAPSTIEGAPHPAVARSRGRGRDDLLANARNATAAGELRLSLLVAPAGAGKSWLLRQADDDARTAGLTTLHTACSADVDDLRALRGWLTDAPRDVQVHEQLRRAVGTAADPTAADSFTTTDTLAPTDTLDIEDLASLLGSFLASCGPVFAVIEDLHHADPVLRDVLSRAVEFPGAAGLIVASCRPGLVDADDLDAATVALRPLGDDEIAAIGADIAPAADARDIVALARGNPLHAREAALAAARGTSAAPLGALPQLIAERLASTDPALAPAIELAAACGETVWPEAAGPEFAAAAPRLYVLGLLEPVMDSALAGTSEARWAHPLLREVAYESTPVAARAAHHETIARTLVDREGADVEFVASHARDAFRLGRTTLAPFTADMAQRAADAAMDRSAVDGAQRWIALIDEAGFRPEARLTERFSDVLEAVGDLPRAREAAMTALDRFGHPGDRARVARKLGTIRRQEGDYEEAHDWHRQAHTLLEDVDDPAEVVELFLSEGSLSYYETRYDDSERQTLCALEGAIAIGDDLRAGRAHLLLEMSYSERADPRAHTHAQAALERLERVGADRELGNLNLNVGVTAHNESRWDDALRHYDRAIELSERVGDAITRALAYNNRAETLTDRGAYDEAEANLSTAHQLCRVAGFAGGVFTTTSGLSRVALRTGRFAEARQLLDRAFELIGELGSKFYVVDTMIREVELLIATGDPQGALAYAQRTQSQLDDAGGAAFFQMMLSRLRGAALARTGEIEQAAADLATALALAREHRADYEEALTLATAIRWLPTTEPAECDQVIRITERLGIVALPLV